MCLCAPTCAQADAEVTAAYSKLLEERKAAAAHAAADSAAAAGGGGAGGGGALPPGETDAAHLQRVCCNHAGSLMCSCPVCAMFALLAGHSDVPLPTAM